MKRPSDKTSKVRRTGQYGPLHSISLFIAKTIPRGVSDLSRALTDAFMALDQIQSKNPWVTLTMINNDGLWVSHKGERKFLLLPAQKHITILFSKPGDDLSKKIDRVVKNGLAEDITIAKSNYRRFRLSPKSLSAVISIVQNWTAPSSNNPLNEPSHPRFFSGPDRQAALEHFERSGRVCSGTGSIKPHKLSTSDRVEFDHIIPYSRNGASSILNIQVLCVDCNRTKSAKAN